LLYDPRPATGIYNRPDLATLLARYFSHSPAVGHHPFDRLVYVVLLARPTKFTMKEYLRKTAVYVAGPFRGANYWEQELNIRRAEELAMKAWNLPGTAVLCPHTNTRFFQGAAPDEVWLDGDIELLRRCDVVLLTEDWRRSSGARAEVEFALAMDIPVFDSIDALSYWLAYKRGEVPSSWFENFRIKEAA
jgi:nucleoside 2-deoxyribosyltransferase